MVQRHRLTINQRLIAGQERYMKMLKCWGTGTSADPYHKEQLEKDMCVTSEHGLMDFVFGEAIKDPINNCDLISHSAILTPRNDVALALDNRLQVVPFNLPVSHYFHFNYRKKSMDVIESTRPSTKSLRRTHLMHLP